MGGRNVKITYTKMMNQILGHANALSKNTNALSATVLTFKYNNSGLRLIFSILRRCWALELFSIKP